VRRSAGGESERRCKLTDSGGNGGLRRSGARRGANGGERARTAR
jgi:hypothetical protein